MKKILISLVLVSLLIPSLAFARPFQPLPIIAVVKGCTDSSAFNYNPDANTDDGSCIPVVKGCIDARMSNYDSTANTDDGNCRIYPTLMLKPAISKDVMITGGIGGVTFSFLTNKFMSCGLLISQESQAFAVNSDSIPTLNGWTMFDNLGGFYGYNRLASQEQGNFTWHILGVPLEKGDYFIRILCDYSGKPILSSEFPVTIR